MRVFRWLAVTAIVFGANWGSLASAELVETDQPAAIEAESETFTDVVNAAKASMMRDPVAAFEHAQRAEGMLDAESATPIEDRATVWWLQAEALTRQGLPADARPLATQALEALGPDAAPSKLLADILVAIARIEHRLGGHGQALEDFQRAYEMFQVVGDTRSEAIVLQSMGSIYREAHQYDRAVEYYSRAIERHSDPSLDLAAYNNLGNAYRELDLYDEALAHFDRALEISSEMGSPILEARILNNIGGVHARFGQFADADRVVDDAFSRLPDPTNTEWTRFLWGVRAQSAYGRGEHASAADMIARTFDGLSTRETPSHFKEFHETAANIYQAVGDWQRAVPHLEAFKRLDDEAREVAASANSALLGAQFEFAEQELQIEQLRAEQLEQELEIAGAAARQRLAFGGGVLIFMIGLTLTALWRQRAAKENQLLAEKALYEDAETGLPTRAALERVVDRTVCEINSPVVVVAMGIDRYKHLEGALGFARAAEMHLAIAARLDSDDVVSSPALIAPGILGLVVALPDTATAQLQVSRIQDQFADSIEIGGITLDVSHSFGLAVGMDGETCVKQALIGLEQAREQDQHVAVFNAERFGDPVQNLTLMSRMLEATRSGALELNYQPKLNLKTGTYAGVEALCRWNDPERGFVSPATFIPLAEETGHIRDLTEWTLRQSIEDQRKLAEQGHDVIMSINMSGALVSDPEFAARALEIARTAAGQLTFEITETSAMRNPERALANLELWASAGIKLAIDDYGTGLSSLAYLKSIPSSELKLDRAFVTHIAESNRDRMLVKSTTDLAHSLGLEMTAEGVETEEGLALLKLFGCDWAQGFVLSKALPLDGLSHFLDENTHVEIQSVPFDRAQAG